MKKNLYLSFTTGLFCFAVIISFSARAQSKDELAIRAVMDKQTNEWNKGNIDGFMETYWHSDSMVFVGSAGPNYGWQTTLENYKKHYPDTATMGKLNFKIISVKQLSAAYGFVLGKWHLTRTIGDVGGSFTLLFRKIKGKWLIVADHSS